VAAWGRDEDRLQGDEAVLFWCDWGRRHSEEVRRQQMSSWELGFDAAEQP
jgi:hypothetical protein